MALTGFAAAESRLMNLDVSHALLAKQSFNVIKEVVWDVACDDGRRVITRQL